MTLEVPHHNPETASENPLLRAGEALNNAFSEYEKEPILFLSSGGSSLPLLDLIDVSQLGQHVTVAALDERFSLNPSENNFAQIAGSKFYETAKSKGVSFIDTRVRPEETQEELFKRYEASLKEWFFKNPNGKVIATVGIGPDGHASGIMPYPEDPQKFKELFEGDNLVVSYDAFGKNPFSKRVTTTVNLIRKIDKAICYVVGDGKKNAIQKVLSPNGSVSETPARVLHEIRGKALLFTDQTIVY